VPFEVVLHVTYRPMESRPHTSQLCPQPRAIPILNGPSSRATESIFHHGLYTDATAFRINNGPPRAQAIVREERFELATQAAYREFAQRIRGGYREERMMQQQPKRLSEVRDLAYPAPPISAEDNAPSQLSIKRLARDSSDQIRQDIVDLRYVTKWAGIVHPPPS